MKKYFCRSCSYKFIIRSARIPKDCPACGSNAVKEEYDANTLLKELVDEPHFKNELR